MAGRESAGAKGRPTSLPEELFLEVTEYEIVEGELLPRGRFSPRWDAATELR